MSESNANPRVKLATSQGDIVIELDPAAAPATVENFLRYVSDGHYAGTIFHRVIPDFMIQGGGLDADMRPKKNHPPIPNEAANALPNERGTIAMARTADPNSATAQFFINHKDNAFLNYQGPANPGYAAFGRVTQGLDILDKIAAVPTHSRAGHDDVPTETITIEKAELLE